MIISHEHSFVFIKTRKTAGTSIEIWLSQVCGPEDVITPISGGGSEIRRRRGYPGSQNVLVPFRRYSPRDVGRLVLRGRRARYHNHMLAEQVRRYMGAPRWNDYFTFSFERNPWDRVVSYWRFISERDSIEQPFRDFVLSDRLAEVRNWELYTRGDELLVDYVGRFEDLHESLRMVREWLDLPELALDDLPHAKRTTSGDSDHYSTLYDEEARERVARVFRQEIERFGYEFEVSAT